MEKIILAGDKVVSPSRPIEEEVLKVRLSILSFCSVFCKSSEMLITTCLVLPRC